MHNCIELAPDRQRSQRWLVLLALDAARPIGAFESTILTILRVEFPAACLRDVRLALEFLAAIGFVSLQRTVSGKLLASLTSRGEGVAAYRAPCPPGIGRPMRDGDATPISADLPKPRKRAELITRRGAAHVVELA